MVRRGRSGALNPSPPTQRRLDDAFGESVEARSEAEYRELRETKGSHTVLPYEERVAAWIREREDAMRKRAGSDQALPASDAPRPVISGKAPAGEAGGSNKT